MWPAKRKPLFILILAAAWTSGLQAAERCDQLQTGLESGVLDQLNLARQDPPGYSFHLQDLRESYHGKEREIDGNTNIVTQEGVPALDEAIHVLEVTKARSPLAWDPCLSASAAEHVRDTGPLGSIGHDSSKGEGFASRVKRYVKAYRQAGENIDYGSTTPADVVQQLLIDDGVPDRGHRRNIFEPGFNRAGVACGPHTKFGTMCVIDFARE